MNVGDSAGRGGAVFVIAFRFRLLKRVIREGGRGVVLEAICCHVSPFSRVLRALVLSLTSFSGVLVNQQTAVSAVRVKNATWPRQILALDS